MNIPNIQDSKIENIKGTLNYSDFISDDIMLYDSLSKLAIPSSPRRMTFIVVALCTSGCARFSVDTKEILALPGNLVVISERHIINDYRADEGTEGLCMVLSPKFFYDIIQQVDDLTSMFMFTREHPVVELTDKQIEMFRDYFKLLQRKVAEMGNRMRDQITKAIVLAMFYEFCNISQSNKDARHQSRSDIIFGKFISLVESNYRTERRVGWYADQLCITPKYLAETVKTASLRSPNEWIDNYVTLELRLLLKNTSKSIKEIAEELHFPNQSFLGKYFREHVGLSPSEYRKR